MSETKHTPGPWQTDESGHRIEWSNWIIANGVMIAAVTETSQAPEISDANARLIAAAPDLLGALSDILAAYSIPLEKDLQRASLAKGRDAVARAEA